MPVIDVEDVEVEFGHGANSRLALREVTVRLDEPRIGVIGANGSGKSTFARLMNALITPTGGSVRIDGLDTRKQAKEIRRRVGFCFTDPDNQIVMPTVAEDIAFGLRRRGLTRDQIQARVDSALLAFNLSDHRDHPAHLLSGGQKQLLALSSVLVTEPDLLVMDEPTTLLDLANSRAVSQVIAELPQQVILVTHHLDLLEDFDRVLVFADARLVYDAAPEQALAYYRGLVAP
ncbi:MAG: ABC transporter ATP-binding protein [Nocardioidaceae bacterium]|nr:MAG: ABC transporter ATP-binding protein [Nocardioidaceae bacterium]